MKRADADPTVEIRWTPLPVAFRAPSGSMPSVFVLDLHASPLLLAGHDPTLNAWLADWPRTIETVVPKLRLLVKLRSEAAPRRVALTWDRAKFGRTYPRKEDAGRSIWRDLFAPTAHPNPRARAKRTEAEPVVPRLKSLGDLSAARPQAQRLKQAFDGAPKGFTTLDASERDLLDNMALLSGQSGQAVVSLEDEQDELLRFNSVVGSLLRLPEVARDVGLIVRCQFSVDDETQPASIEWIEPSDLASAVDEKSALADSTRHVRARVMVDGASDLGARFAAAARSFTAGFGALTKLRMMSLQGSVPVQTDPVAEAYRARGADVAGADVTPTSHGSRLLVMNAGVADWLNSRGQRGLELRKTSEPVIYAEDLVRGFAVDVRNSGKNAWHSLCARDARYKVERSANPAWTSEALPNTRSLPATGTLRDEGTVQCAALGGGPYERVVSDAVIRLDGWSLVCPRPFPASESTPEHQLDPLKLVVSRPPPGTVLPLRWGEQYVLRARYVDLAGNDMSAQFRDAEGQPADELVSFKLARVEPMAAPVIGFAKPPPPELRESTRQVVVGRVRRVKGKPTRGVEAQRRVAPPQTSFDVCELADAVSRDTREVFALLRRRDLAPNGAPGKAAKDNEMVLPDTCKYISEPWVKSAAFDYRDHIRTTANVTAKFLGNWPDQDVTEILVRPGKPPDDDLDDRLDEQERTTDRLSIDWDEKIGQRVTPLKWEASRFTVIVEAPLAATVSLAIRSELEPRFVERWSIVEGAGVEGVLKVGIAALARPQRDFVAGEATIDIVAPVAFPLMRPRVLQGAEPIVVRAAGQLDSNVVLPVLSHAPSTGQISVCASWEDRDGRGNHRSSHSNVVVTTFPVAPYVHGDDSQTSGFDRSRYPTGTTLSRISVRQNHADTRHRIVRYVARGVTRFLDHFPREETELDGELEPQWSESRSVSVSIPSSRAPEIVTVEEALPLYRQVRVPNGAYTVNCTGGTRLYLGSAWWSSGDGERLAILLPSAQGANEDLSTVWGNDPIHAARQTPNLARAHFDGEGATRIAHTIERGRECGRVVELLVLPVSWDLDRESWYVDLTVEISGTMTPMVRFALARFQANAVAGEQLSDVVRTEFIQVPPQRTLVIHSDGVPHISLKGAGVLASTVDCAIFRREVSEESLPVPNAEATFDDPFRGAESRGRPIPASDGVNGLQFKFDAHAVRRGDRLVVRERLKDTMDGTLAFNLRTTIVQLEEE